ncbi:hypothetical protein COOONC_16857 [Cooperia oncophora]
MLPLPTFSGSNMGTGFMNFLNEFYEISHIMGINEAQMARLLPAHLKGVAKAVYENLSDDEKADWRVAVTKTKEHFSTDQFLDLARERIMCMKMEPNESPVLFSHRIKKELMEAYLHTTFAERRNFLQDIIFTNGLPNKTKDQMKLLGPLPTNYDTLLRDAERMYDIIKTRSLPEEDLLIAKIDRAIDTIISNRNPVLTTTRSGRRPNRAYNPKSEARENNVLNAFIASSSAFSLKYQLCAAGKSGWPIAFPDPLSKSSQVLITGADLYVERTEPLLLPAYHCFNKTRKICASSYLHISFSVNSDEDFMTPIDPALCESLTQTKKHLDVPLENSFLQMCTDQNQIKYSYPWFFGEKCTVTTNVYFEKQLQLSTAIT